MAEFTGERIIPGEVDPDLLNEHLARYAFAVRFAHGKRVLDAGCGTGYGSAELARAALEVTGVDSSVEAIAYAREHYPGGNLRFATADCTALPIPDACFDLVVAFEVIEHLSDWRRFLAEARRVLAPAGRLVVSTPNRLYYAESRRQAGPNPFHVHEFDFDEFRSELSAVFPHLVVFLENHSAGVVFQPVGSGLVSEVRVEGACSPAESHFFVALCALEADILATTFVYVPRAANVLREREQHIQKLETELAVKNEWLEKLKASLAALNGEHQKLLEMFRGQKEELEERNRWAGQLNRELAEAGQRIVAIQEELEREHAIVRTIAATYETRVSDLEQENARKTEWALDIEARLGAATADLTRAVDLLHDAEQTLEDRTKWAFDLQARLDQFERQLSMVRASLDPIRPCPGSGA